MAVWLIRCTVRMPGNVARFVNHSCDPNLIAVLERAPTPMASTDNSTSQASSLVQDGRKQPVGSEGEQAVPQSTKQQAPGLLLGATRVLFKSRRAIAAGEELTVDYCPPPLPPLQHQHQQQRQDQQQQREYEGGSGGGAMTMASGAVTAQAPVLFSRAPCECGARHCRGWVPV